MISLIILGVIVLIIIALIFSYIIIYNKNANKVLKTGKRNVLVEKEPVIKILMFMILIVITCVSLVSIIQAKKELIEYQNQLNRIEQTLKETNNRISELQNKFDAYLKENQQVTNVQYNFKNPSVDNQDIDFEISFMLKETHPSSVVKIVAHSENELATKEYTFINNSGIFNTTLKLLLEENYDFYIVDNQIDNIFTYRLFIDINTSLDKFIFLKSSILFFTDGKNNKTEIYQETYFYNKYEIEEFEVEKMIFKINKSTTNEEVYRKELFKNNENIYKFLIPNEFYNTDEYYFTASVLTVFGEILLSNSNVEK